MPIAPHGLDSTDSTPLVSPTALVPGTLSSIDGVMETPRAGESSAASEVKEQSGNAFSPSEDELGEMVTLPSLPRSTVDSFMMSLSKLAAFRAASRDKQTPRLGTASNSQQCYGMARSPEDPADDSTAASDLEHNTSKL